MKYATIVSLSSRAVLSRAAKRLDRRTAVYQIAVLDDQPRFFIYPEVSLCSVQHSLQITKRCSDKIYGSVPKTCSTKEREKLKKPLWKNVH